MHLQFKGTPIWSTGVLFYFVKLWIILLIKGGQKYKEYKKIHIYLICMYNLILLMSLLYIFNYWYHFLLWRDQKDLGIWNDRCLMHIMNQVNNIVYINDKKDRSLLH